MRIDPKADNTARRIHERGKVQKASFLGGRKVNGLIQTESRLEASAVFMAELDPRVAKLSPQPFTIDLGTGRVWRSKAELMEAYRGKRLRPKVYTPDFRILLASGRQVLLETKHTRFLLRSSASELPGLLAQMGLRLIIATEADLWGPVDHNARLLCQYLDHAPGPDLAADLARWFVEPRAIEFAFSAMGLTQRDVLGAIATGHLACDLRNARLTPRTAVRAALGDRSYLELLKL